MGVRLPNAGAGSRGPGLAALAATLLLAACSEDDAPTTPEPAATRAEGQEPAPQNAQLVGRILDGLGNPLVGGIVLAQPMLPRLGRSPAETPLARGRSGADGVFTVDLAPGTEIVAVVQHPDYVPKLLPGPFALSAGRRLDLDDIELRSRPGLVIEVVDPAGVAISDARVRAEPILTDSRLPPAIRATLRREGQTDSRGRTVLAALPAGAHRITTTAPGHVAREEIVRLDPPTAAPRLHVVLRRARPLSCRIATPGGEGVAGARVSAQPEVPGLRSAGVTDQAGVCALDGLPEGPLVLRAEVPSYGEFELQIPASESAVTLALPRGQGIRGRVTSQSEDRGPVPGAEVRLGAELGPLAIAEGLVLRPWTTTDRDGKFALLGLPGGSYPLHVSSEGFLPRSVSRAAQPMGIDLVVPLDRAPEVTGKVLSAGGLPLAGATIELFEITMDGTAYIEQRARIAGSERVWRSVLSDGAGGFRLPSVLPGRYALRVRAPRHAPAVVGPIDATATGADIGRIRLLPPAWIRGHALDRNRNPAARVLVCADPRPSAPPGTAAVTALSDSDGAFTLGPLSAGSYELFYYSPGRQTAAQATACLRATRSIVEVSTGEDVQHDLIHR